MGQAAYNLEFSHLYVDETVGADQHSGAALARETVERLTREGASVSTSVLIDDYNPKDWTLDLESAVNDISERGISINYIVLESKLALRAGELLTLLNEDLQRYYLSYVASHQRWPCSFLVAVWYLMRLGEFQPYHLVPISPNGIPFCADKLITVLPARFKDTERSARRILHQTQFADALAEKLEYIFF